MVPAPLSDNCHGCGQLCGSSHRQFLVTFDWDLDGLEVEIRILSIIHLFSFYFLVGSFFVSGFIVFFNNSGKKYRESIGLYSDDDN